MRIYLFFLINQQILLCYKHFCHLNDGSDWRFSIQQLRFSHDSFYSAWYLQCGSSLFHFCVFFFYLSRECACAVVIFCTWCVCYMILSFYAYIFCLIASLSYPALETILYKDWAKRITCFFHLIFLPMIEQSQQFSVVSMCL